MVEVFLPMIVSFVIVLAVGPICIPILRRLKMGNTEREYIKEHKVKNGTPSMGGIMILIGFAVVGFYNASLHPHSYPILFLTLGFGLLGFLCCHLGADRCCSCDHAGDDASGKIGFTHV